MTAAIATQRPRHAAIGGTRSGRRSRRRARRGRLVPRGGAPGAARHLLLHHAGRPVLAVPGGGGDLSGAVVIGYDGSAPARVAITQAGRLLAGRDAIVVNIWESMIRHSLASMPFDEFKVLTSDMDEYFHAVAAELAAEGAALAGTNGLRARPDTVEAAGPAWRGLLAAARPAAPRRSSPAPAVAGASPPPCSARRRRGSSRTRTCLCSSSPAQLRETPDAGAGSAAARAPPQR